MLSKESSSTIFESLLWPKLTLNPGIISISIPLSLSICMYIYIYIYIQSVMIKYQDWILNLIKTLHFWASYIIKSWCTKRQHRFAKYYEASLDIRPEISGETQDWACAALSIFTRLSSVRLLFYQNENLSHIIFEEIERIKKNKTA